MKKTYKTLFIDIKSLDTQDILNASSFIEATGDFSENEIESIGGEF